MLGVFSLPTNPNLVMDLHLTGKVALVTGAASGIGRAIAESLAAEGARVVVSDLEAVAPVGREVCNRIQADGGEARFIACDVSNGEEVRALIEQTIEAYGRLDVAVNNAGIGGPQAATEEYTEADWDRVMAINLRGVWLCMKHELARLTATTKEGAPDGAIVNVASILGLVGFAAAPAYVAAKHGVVGLTKAAALEYGPIGIRVNAVCPAFIETPMLEQAGLLDDPATRRQLEGLHAMNRLGQPAEVARRRVASRLLPGTPRTSARARRRETLSPPGLLPARVRDFVGSLGAAVAPGARRGGPAGRAVPSRSRRPRPDYRRVRDDEGRARKVRGERPAPADGALARAGAVGSRGTPRAFRCAGCRRAGGVGARR